MNKHNIVKINPECPKCNLINILFDFHKLPMNCIYCGADLEEENEIRDNQRRKRGIE